MLKEKIKLQSKCKDCIFKRVVCQYLTEEEFSRLYSNTIHLKFRKGETILKQGDKLTRIVYLSQGMVKLNYEDEFNRNLILAVVKAPKILGDANLFNEDANMFSIIAVDKCEVCLIDINILKIFALQNSAFALRLINFIFSAFKDFFLNYIGSAHKQVNGRVAYILVYLSKKVYKSKSFTLNLTRKELAEFAGYSQENIIHTLSKFHKENIIKLDGKKIKIIDLNKLTKISRIG